MVERPLVVQRFENYLLELGHHFWRHFIESASEGGDDLTLIFRQLFYRYVTRLTNAETYVRKFSPRRRPHVTQIRDCGLVAQNGPRPPVMSASGPNVDIGQPVHVGVN